MTFITGLITGLFIGAWVGVLAMCLCRGSSRAKNVTGGGAIRAPEPPVTAFTLSLNLSVIGRNL